MKIGILSRDTTLYSTQRLIHACQQRGHRYQLIDVLACQLELGSGAFVQQNGKILQGFDAIIPRIGTQLTMLGCAVLRQFEQQQIFTLNSAQAISTARNKLQALQQLSQSGIAIPKTVMANCAFELEKLLQRVDGPPVVIKLLEGSQGIGVALAESVAAATSTLETFMGLKVDVLIQEYIKEANGADLRCFVLGGKVVAAMQRQAKAGEFRANLHRGGSTQKVTLCEQEKDIAVACVKALGLQVAGVDILRSARGPLVLEVNASPGLEGIEKACGLDIADMMIAHIEQQLRA
ncbi:MAG: 30S ribosomal protein S6--L-glutamate ligase [Vibrionaceae bacterium]